MLPTVSVEDTVIVLTLTCNTPGCAVQYVTNVTANHRKARALARSRGWTCLPGRGDWCPRHPHHAPQPRPRRRKP